MKDVIEIWYRYIVWVVLVPCRGALLFEWSNTWHLPSWEHTKGHVSQNAGLCRILRLRMSTCPFSIFSWSFFLKLLKKILIHKQYTLLTSATRRCISSWKNGALVEQPSTPILCCSPIPFRFNHSSSFFFFSVHFVVIYICSVYVSFLLLLRYLFFLMLLFLMKLRISTTSH